MTYTTFIYTIIIGFLCGGLIPVTASRFGKVLPADPGLILANLWHRPRCPKIKTGNRYLLWRYKWRKMAVYSLGWALIMAGLFSCAYAFIGEDVLVWSCSFLFVIGLLMAIDQQYFLLPDFFTIPLLFMGFGFAVLTDMISPMDSFVGAVFGYILCTASVFVMNLFRKAEFGAGDVKMVTALGAWLGYMPLNITLLLSFIFFAIWSVWQGKRTGAFGPALGLATIIVLFVTYSK